MRFNGVPERFISDHLVLVSATDLLSPNKSFFFQVLDNSLNGSFGDPDSIGDLSQYQIGIAMDRDQDMRVIA